MNARFAALAAAAAAPLLVITACAGAPERAYAGDPVEGHEVARSMCSSCHAIDLIGASPNPVAPPLRYVLAGHDPDRLIEDFENSVSISHLRMPTFYLGEHHPADLVAYLKTIQQTPF